MHFAVGHCLLVSLSLSLSLTLHYCHSIYLKCGDTATTKVLLLLQLIIWFVVLLIYDKRSFTMAATV